MIRVILNEINHGSSDVHSHSIAMGTIAPGAPQQLEHLLLAESLRLKAWSLARPVPATIADCMCALNGSLSLFCLPRQIV